MNHPPPSAAAKKSKFEKTWCFLHWPARICGAVLFFVGPAEDGDPAVAVRVRILLAHGAAQGLRDVFDQQLVVQHGAVLKKGVVAEHDIAVAAVFDHIVVGCHGIGLRGIQGLSAHLHVGYPVRAVHLHEVPFIRSHYAGGNGNVDGVGESGNVQESSVLLRIVGCAQLQGVQNFLPGGFHDAHLVPIRMDVDDVFIGDIARGQIRADAAAVGEADLRAHYGAVCVGHHVAQVRLPAADAAKAGGGIIGSQVHVGFGDYLPQDIFQTGVERLQEDVGYGLLLVVIFHQFADDVPGGRIDDHLADGVEFGPGLSQKNIFAVFVLHDFLIGFVGMTVDEHVDTAGIGDDGSGLPGRGDSFRSEMADGHDVIRPLGPCHIHAGLDVGVQIGAVVALTEAVNVIAGFILEVDGSGFCKGLGSGDSHIGHLRARIIDHPVRGEHEGSGGQIDEVAAQVSIVRPVLGQIQEILHAVVEFMVARNGDVVAHLVHGVHQKGAVRKGAQRAALNRVAGVHQGDVIRAVLKLHLVAVGGQAGVADALLHTAVHIVGMKNDDFSRLRRCG